MKEHLILDIESYPNYFLIAIKHLEINQIRTIELKTADARLIDFDDSTFLKNVLELNISIGFNIHNYDFIMIYHCVKLGYTAKQLNELSNRIILNNERFNLNLAHWESIDLINLPLGMHSLKLYAARLNTKSIQSLPYEPNTILTNEQMEDVKQYCINDLQLTQELYQELKLQIDLRAKMSETYGEDLRSKSDAQIAEFIIRTKLGYGKYDKKEIKPKESFKYIAPKHIKFKSAELNNLLKIVQELEFTYTDKLNVPEMFNHLSYTSPSGLTFQLGIGGLHSTESEVNYKSVANEFAIIDCDVASFYPSIIINNNYYPEHLGNAFMPTYKGIVEERLKAKASGDKVTADTLKIVINSSFGKFGNQYSVLFSNELMIQITITGQLYLLMLIEKLEANGIKVISANTDGIISFIADSKINTYKSICTNWEKHLNLTLEFTVYKAIYSRDVNNYIALGLEKVKLKGVFTHEGLNKNPQHSVCYKAVISHLVYETVIENYIESCHKIDEFVLVRTVKGGASFNGVNVGKVVRYYWSTNGSKITYTSNGNTVANSSGSNLLQTIPEDFYTITDIDYKRYIATAYEILESVGIKENKGLF
jgi:hypothetical protein